jgi:Ala-tRNA(Pro) deacylase
MPATALIEFLDQHLTPYTSVRHEPAFAALEAATMHVRGKDMAKTVIVKIDGALAMVVLPADHKVDLGALQCLTNARDVRLVTEEEFKYAFPDCEVGGMPPFGNLFELPSTLTSGWRTTTRSPSTPPRIARCTG